MQVLWRLVLTQGNFNSQQSYIWRISFWSYRGMFVSGLIALVVGIPTLRLKGDYLAIATLGVSEIIRILLVNLRGLTNGPAGIFGLPQFSNWQIVFLLLSAPSWWSLILSIVDQDEQH